MEICGCERRSLAFGVVGAEAVTAAAAAMAVADEKKGSTASPGGEAVPVGVALAVPVGVALVLPGGVSDEQPRDSNEEPPQVNLTVC